MHAMLNRRRGGGGGVSAVFLITVTAGQIKRVIKTSLTFVFWSDSLSFLQINLKGAEKHSVSNVELRLLRIPNISKVNASGHK